MPGLAESVNSLGTIAATLDCYTRAKAFLSIYNELRAASLQRRVGGSCMSLSPSRMSHVQGKRTREPGGCVSPDALNHCVEADMAVRTRAHRRPESHLAGTARASRAYQCNAQKLSNNHSEEPEIEQKGSEHPKTPKHAHGMLGIEADERGGQDKHQEPSQAASNVQLQLDVFPHTHGPIVLARVPIRSLFHPGDVPFWRHRPS
jgi:hypothetical protein